MNNENKKKLESLLVDVFLLEPEEFRFDLKRDEVDTWDSLAVVSMAVGVQETFGYHFTPEEAVGIKCVQDIVNLLEGKGVRFDG
jgi:acyl carrier protein